MTQTTGPLAPTVDIRRAAERFKTRLSWLDSKHSFSFSRHYDPLNTHHGLLLVSNDDVVTPGTGFETHPHQDMEIVTWVLRGSLVHQDSTGHAGIIYPGLAQRMSAGTGILHSEKNDSWRLQGGSEHTEPVHFVQMWVVPDEEGITPGYEQLEIDDELLRGGLVPVASGLPKHDGAAAIRIKNSYARCLPPACSQARRSNSRMPPSCTCSCPGAQSRWKVPVRWLREMRCGSRPPAGRRSLPPSPARSSSGRCTPPSPAGNSDAPGMLSVRRPWRRSRGRPCCRRSDSCRTWSCRRPCPNR